jgi:3-methylcrotonyl-CoA carboxylase alpha subunit
LPIVKQCNQPGGQGVFKSLLVANRGEIACRIMATAHTMGIRTIAIYSEADTEARFVREADEAICIGPAPARESYLNGAAILAAAKATGAEAIHPGYGFLSENPAFAESVAAAGLIWVGPPPAAIRAMGLKDEAKRLAEQAGVPVLPGYRGADQSLPTLTAEAEKIGFPLLIKAVAGGGGRGIREVGKIEDLGPQLESAQREAAAAFGDARVMLERLVQRPRHIEVQVFADAHGNAVHLFERDCSLQRRRQKVVEEAPAPGMNAPTRAAMTEAAVKLTRAVGYRGAGTVELIVDGTRALSPDSFWFLEMNTRLQVEHPVTELVTGLDLVEWQLRVAAGEPLPLAQDQIQLSGHAIEARICAEDPGEGFRPAAGRVAVMALPQFDADGDPALTYRLDSAVEAGDAVPPDYDSLIAKAIVHAPDRETARAALHDGLSGARIWPLVSNLGFLVACLADPDFSSGAVHTDLIAERGAALTAGPEAQQVALWAGFVRAFAEDASTTAPDIWPDPWDAADGFRVNGPARLTYVFEVGEGVFPVAMTRSGAGWLAQTATMAGGFAIDGTVTSGQFDQLGGTLWLSSASGPIEIGYMEDGEDLAIIVAGHTVRAARYHPEAAAEGLEAGDLVKSPMPGKLIAVHVKPGDAVTKGQPVLVLEAMKMEHTLLAPRTGVIAIAPSEAGGQVKEGDILIRLELEEEPAIP